MLIIVKITHALETISQEGMSCHSKQRVHMAGTQKLSLIGQIRAGTASSAESSHNLQQEQHLVWSSCVAVRYHICTREQAAAYLLALTDHEPYNLQNSPCGMQKRVALI